MRVACNIWQSASHVARGQAVDAGQCVVIAGHCLSSLALQHVAPAALQLHICAGAIILRSVTLRACRLFKSHTTKIRFRLRLVAVS